MNKVVKGINEVVKYILYLLLVVLIISVFAQVIFRFVINQPLAWTEELARYCLVWLTFLGAAYALRDRQHVGLEFFKNLLPNVGQKLLSVISGIVSICFFVIIFRNGYEIMERSMIQSSPVLQIPMGIVYAVLPISAVLLMINIVITTAEDLKGGQEQ